MVSSKTSTKTYSTDAFMKQFYASMVRDFRTVMGPEYKAENVQALSNIKYFRSISVPDRSQAPPHIFKKEAQLEYLFKRYRFKTDGYTDKQIADRTFQKFMDGQLRLARQDMVPLRQSTFVILQQARKIVKSILQGYDPTASEDFCRFSTRATVGNPARDAYIDHKLADPITGSPEHIKWFNSHLRSNGYLSNVIAKCTPTGEPSFVVCESLPLVGVPKSWKSFRLISPNTLIGSYKTYGLGSILVKALKEAGLDIRRLQDIHKRLARKASKHKKWVTADLSAASESFLWSLICRLLPRKWVVALNEGRLKYYDHDGSRYSYCSFMAMGIGFTFPLQTLLFYAMVKAIVDLSKVKGFVSVYGDDLIYPTEIHPYVKSFLNDIGMVLNDDKTFVETNFRESCGGDYYHGVDVRPFSPEGEYRELRPRAYEAWLYQIANGLHARWDTEEIPITSRFLRLEILRVARLVKQVPPGFPDYSGIRVSSPEVNPFLCVAPVLVRFQNGSREYVVSHLTQTPQKRFVSFEDPYLYEWFRSRDAGDDDDVWPFEARFFDDWLSQEREVRRARTEKIRHYFRDTRDSLTLQPFLKQPKSYRGQDGKRLKRCYSQTPCALQPQQIQTSVTGSISDWI